MDDEATRDAPDAPDVDVTEDVTEDVDDDDVDEREDEDVVVLSWWQHPLNVVALVVASLLIAGMAGWLIADAAAESDAGEVDVGFLHDMRAHHEQAGRMALIYRDLDDTDPGLRTIAGSILVQQHIDIGQMIQMLRVIGAPEAAEGDQAMAWMGMPTTQAAMPGMASEDDLLRLAESSGAEADELFVELMAAHHRGGLHMAETAAAEAGDAEVRSLAASLVAGQQGEVVEMEERLAASRA